MRNVRFTTINLAKIVRVVGQTFVNDIHKKRVKNMVRRG